MYTLKYCNKVGYQLLLGEQLLEGEQSRWW